MAHLLVDITDFEIVAPYTLRIRFSDGAEQTINFEPALYGFYLEPLRNQSLFNQVTLDPETGILTWPNGADFDPATLYNWHKGEGAELARRAQNWQKTAPSLT